MVVGGVLFLEDLASVEAKVDIEGDLRKELEEDEGWCDLVGERSISY